MRQVVSTSQGHPTSHHLSSNQPATVMIARLDRINSKLEIELLSWLGWFLGKTNLTTPGGLWEGMGTS